MLAVDTLASRHLVEMATTLAISGPALDQSAAWGRRLADVLTTEGRLLIAGNGGSAAEAQHLSAELVGRYRAERRAFSALALHADTSSLTAITNDYGAEAMFARQVDAHGLPGSVLLLLSTSGRSPNLLAAAERARAIGMQSWALTGEMPNPLGLLCDEVAPVPSRVTGVVQEVHLVALHVLCAAFDEEIALSDGLGVR